MLFVFDLDFTLWDCGGTWCDCTRPPYRRDGQAVADAAGREITLYHDVLDIIRDLKSLNHQIAAASRTHEPAWARQLLILLDADHLFDYMEIYPGPKHPHFKSLREKSGLDYSEMAFFDDEERNIRDISALGVKSVFVPDGLHRGLIRKILPDF
ncbi:MAG: magnesium-dependent phosphatase-1 [Spirochaetales bacterium]|nr:magnesium-dependent phosphatase-1 [Spirochaetales bacterium]